MNITLEQFSKLMKNEFTSHSSKWITFKYYLDGKLIDPNEVIPYGYIHYYGDCIVDYFSLNDYMKSMSVYLRSNSFGDTDGI